MGYRESATKRGPMTIPSTSTPADDYKWSNRIRADAHERQAWDDDISLN